MCQEDRDEEFEQTPYSQIFDVLSSDSDGPGGIGKNGLDIIKKQ